MRLSRLAFVTIGDHFLWIVPCSYQETSTVSVPCMHDKISDILDRGGEVEGTSSRFISVLFDYQRWRVGYYDNCHIRTWCMVHTDNCISKHEDPTYPVGLAHSGRFIVHVNGSFVSCKQEPSSKNVTKYNNNYPAAVTQHWAILKRLNYVTDTLCLLPNVVLTKMQLFCLRGNLIYCIKQ